MTDVISHMPYLLDAQFAPLLIVAFSIVLLMIGQIARMSHGANLFVVCACLAFAFIVLILRASKEPVNYAAGLSFDGITLLAMELLLPSALIVSVMASFKEASDQKKGTSLLLVLISLLGALITLSSSHWIMFFVGVQCMSLPVYGLLCYDSGSSKSVSSAIRYLVLSGIAIAFLLFGILLTFAAKKTLAFVPLWGVENSAIVTFGIALILAGICFKISLVPFHVWALEVYQGASLFVVSHLILVSKAALIFFLLRNIALFFDSTSIISENLFAFMAIASMWIGFSLMLFEKNILRFLAVFSIGHIGMLMVPLLSNSILAVQAVWMDLLAFGAALIILLFTIKVSFRRPDISIENLRGFALVRPFEGALITVALISLAGIPLTAGFIGKYSIFITASQAKMWHLIMHMAVSQILSIIALSKIILVMFDGSVVVDPGVSNIKRSRGALGLCALLILIVGIFPDPILVFISSHIN